MYERMGAVVGIDNGNGDYFARVPGVNIPVILGGSSQLNFPIGGEIPLNLGIKKEDVQRGSGEVYFTDQYDPNGLVLPKVQTNGNGHTGLDSKVNGASPHSANGHTTSLPSPTLTESLDRIRRLDHVDLVLYDTGSNVALIVGNWEGADFLADPFSNLGINGSGGSIDRAPASNPANSNYFSIGPSDGLAGDLVRLGFDDTKIVSGYFSDRRGLEEESVQGESLLLAFKYQNHPGMERLRKIIKSIVDP